MQRVAVIQFGQITGIRRIIDTLDQDHFALQLSDCFDPDPERNEVFPMANMAVAFVTDPRRPRRDSP